MSTPHPDAKSFSLSAGQKVGGGRFTLVRHLGQGGMGVVWLAQDERLGESVALKFLPAEIRGDATALADLRRETRKSRQLTHPHIIRIHDIVETEGEPSFISMEYVEGWNLSALQHQQPQGVLTWSYLQPLVAQMCGALDYAHGQNVIHRDLKPANLMLTTGGQIKLADFGIAATLSDSASRISLQPATSGTVTYMSPQQMSGEKPCATDDLYSLGATLYELLTSRPPFYTGNIPHQVMNVPAKAIAERQAELAVNNPVPAEVSATVLACLAKDPQQRPQSAQSVAQWIWGGEVQVDPAANATAPTSIEAPRQPTQIKPWWIWGGAAAMVVVVLLCFLFWPAKKQSSVKTEKPMGISGASRWTNSLGMVFLAVPGTKVLFSIYETRVQDFEEFVQATRHDMGNQLMMGRADGWKSRPNFNWRNPGFSQAPSHPVVGVNWHDAQAYCHWLSTKEQAAGLITQSQRYRLPTDAEWSAAVGPAKFPWGDTWPPPPHAGNYGGLETVGADWPVNTWGRMTNYTDQHVFSAPVGSYLPNALGLYDLGGNAWEWCADYYRAELNPVELRAAFKSMNQDGDGQQKRVFRGASWVDPHREILASANRLGTGDSLPDGRADTVGFRVVLANESM